MSTEPTHVATTEEAVEYIRNALIAGTLNMADATKTLGWTFPRVRSRALTICKKMKGTFVKESRGIYRFEPGENGVEPVVDAPVSADNSIGYTAEEIERAVLNIGDDK